jgi:hypothetical protein
MRAVGAAPLLIGLQNRAGEVAAALSAWLCFTVRILASMEAFMVRTILIFVDGLWVAVGG